MRLSDELAVIDCNAFLGNWAVRSLRHTTAPELVAMMDRFGIERACVARADAILYRDCQAGNERLYNETRRYAERFWLYATVNPAYAGWQRDLQRCVDLGFAAIRLYPQYHGYGLDSREAAALADAAVEAGLPVSAACRVEGVRQRHWLDTTENLDLADFVRFAEAHPKGTYILTEAYLGAQAGDSIWERLKEVAIHFELSRMTSLLDNPLGRIQRILGAERLLFGTGFPFKCPSPAFLKVQVLDASETEKRLITNGNARRIFQADPRSEGCRRTSCPNRGPGRATI